MGSSLSRWYDMLHCRLWGIRAERKLQTAHAQGHKEVRRHGGTGEEEA